MGPTYGCRDTCINSCPRKCRVPAFSIKQLLSFDPPSNQFTICVLPSRFPGWSLTLSTIPNFRNHLGPWVIPLKPFSLGGAGGGKGKEFWCRHLREIFLITCFLNFHASNSSYRKEFLETWKHFPDTSFWKSASHYETLFKNFLSIASCCLIKNSNSASHYTCVYF